MDAVYRKQKSLTELLQESTHSLAEAQCTRPLLPDPEKLTGTSVKFDRWVAAIRAKLELDAEAIGDAQAPFYYVEYDQTSGNDDYNAIIDQLAGVFETSNNVQEAENGLSDLKLKGEL
ncbi:hypothetical protein N7481_006759 [Penicillium waksmanii]|uniref:uncharacterized protein n=1 Tax=Penicillium waksmanii TaxID=69791 RepID=UPI0025488F18|nr:uncharacterized protein N7481_006759 [Penicillium waksmanii]KAJ5984660.1 hypothetical protein N7481_006759 [Penicillium waksmanii]